ncbi:MAG: hypothetical protein QW478_06450 [Candidatus Micrarchaeaceae archaeon]
MQKEIKKNLKWYIGMRVAVLKANTGKKDDKKFLGYGIIVKTKTIEVLGEKHTIPIIKMDKIWKSGILGHECWWVPENQYKKLIK